MADLQSSIYNAVANYTTNPLYALDPAKLLLGASANAGQIISQNQLNAIRSKSALLDLLSTGLSVWGQYEKTKAMRDLYDFQRQKLANELVNQKLKELALYNILKGGGF